MEGYKRLYKSRKDKVLCGVCGGLGESVGVDPVLVRVLWVLFALGGGSGLLAYLIACLIIPHNPSGDSVDLPNSDSPPRRAWWGALLVILGVILLLVNFKLFSLYLWGLWGLSWKVVWPLLFILLGVAIILRKGRPQQKGRLYRSREERMLGGVCGGLGIHFNLDPTLFRIAWVVGTFASWGVGIVAYIVMLFIVPEEQPEVEP